MSLFQCSIGEDDDDSGSLDVYADVWGAFITTVTLYGALGLGCFVFFEVMRSKQKVYASRANCLPHRIPPLPPPKAGRWVQHLWGMEDSEILAIAGMDGYVFLRFLGFCLRVCFASTIMSCGALVPTYFYSGGTVESLFGQLTMDNVPPGSRLLYSSAVGTYLLTIGALYAIDCECKFFSKSREEFMISGDPDIPGGNQMMYTCLVENIPKHLRSEAALHRYFDGIFPGQVQGTVVHMNIKDSGLEKTIATADKTCTHLDSLILARDALRKSGGGLLNKLPNPFGDNHNIDLTSIELEETIPRVATKSAARASEVQDEADGLVLRSTLMFKTVFAVPYCNRRLEELNALVAEKQKHLLTLSAEIEADPAKKFVTNLYSSSGVVTFKSKSAATMAIQVLLSNKQGFLEVFPAPDARDVVWGNCSSDFLEAKKKSAATSLAVKGVGAFLFIPALVFCNVFGDLDKLAKVPGLGGLGSLKPGSIFYDFITGQVPPLLQSILIGLLPLIFTAIAIKFEGKKQNSAISQSVLDRGFGFQLINIYFTLLGSSLSSTIQDVLNEPGCLFQLLGSSVPAVAGYFIQLICINGLFGMMMELSRIPVFASVVFFEKVTSKNGASERSRRALFVDAITQFSAALVYPALLLVLILNFTYATIVPFLSATCTLYFAIACTVYRYNYLYAYAPVYEAGGHLFPTLYNYVLTGLNFANVTMVGYMVIKEGFVQSIMVLLLIPITEYYRGYMAETHFKRMVFLGCEGSAAFDRENGDGLNTKFDDLLYRQPALHQLPFLPETPHDQKMAVVGGLNDKEF